MRLSSILAWYLVDWCSTVLRWSHISQDMFHNFLMSSTVQHLLDFLCLHCAQYGSCCACHSIPSQPSNAASHPRCNCWLKAGMSSLVVIPLHHACIPAMSAWIIWGSVCCCFIHLVRVWIAEFHLFVAASWVHWRMCALSSCSVPQWGHWAKDLCL